MRYMEKEKQAYYHLKKLYAGKPTWLALAEMADSGDLLDIVSEFIDEHEKEITALKSEIERKDEAITKLWDIIDDIDTYDDIAKENDRMYRRLVQKKQVERWDTGIITDGYTLNLQALKDGE